MIRRFLVACILIVGLAPVAHAQEVVDAAKVAFSSTATLTSGSAAPSASEPDGSFYFRTNGQWYQRVGAAWVSITDTSGRLPALSASTLTSLSAANLTNLPAAQLTGTMPYAALPTGAGTWAGATPTIGGNTAITGHLTPTTTDTYDLGSATNWWRQGFLSQMNAVVFAKETQTLYGGWLAVSKNAGILPSSVSSGATTIDFGQAMVANQFVLIRAADLSGTTTSEFLKVGTLVSGTTYNVTRNLSGIGAKNWASGTPYQVRGVAGDGWVELDAFDTPRLSVFTQGSAYNNSTENVRIGYLTGMPNASSGLGFYVGDATNFLRYDSTQLTLKSGSVNIDSAGIGLVTAGSANGQNAYRFIRDTANGFGGTNDQYGVYNSSICVGGGCAQTDFLYLANAMVGGAGHSGNAETVVSATGWNSGTSSALTAQSITLESDQTINAGIVVQGTKLTLQLPVVTTSTISERSRSTPLGEWIDVTYNAGNFTSSGGTWGVDSADVGTLAYTLVGKTMTVVFEITNTDVGATSSILQIAIPGGNSAAKSARNLVEIADAGGAFQVAFANVQASGTVIRIFSNLQGAGWTTTSGDNTHVLGQITFPIQ